jgi:hypothetical protein
MQQPPRWIEASCQMVKFAESRAVCASESEERRLLYGIVRRLCLCHCTIRPESFVVYPSVRHRPHRLLVSLSHQSPAYLDEDYPITIDVTNEDDRELDITADVLLQPTEIDNASMDHVSTY